MHPPACRAGQPAAHPYHWGSSAEGQSMGSERQIDELKVRLALVEAALASLVSTLPGRRDDIISLLTAIRSELEEIGTEAPASSLLNTLLQMRDAAGQEGSEARP